MAKIGPCQENVTCNRIDNATKVLDDMATPDKGISDKIMRDAKCKSPALPSDSISLTIKDQQLAIVLDQTTSFLLP